MFLHFKNANATHYKKSLYAIVVKKMYTKMSSVHGSSVLTVKIIFSFPFLRKKFCESELEITFSGSYKLRERID